MKTVKIAYSDCPNFDFEHFYLTEAMRPFCNPVLSDDPDIVFYSCYAREHMKYQNTLKVFFNGENVHPDFNECDYAISCQPIQYGNRYFRLSDFDITMDASVNDRRGLDVSDKTRFCNFIYSNDHRDQEGARLRMEFCRLLMAYKHVDCPGRVLHNLDAPELVGRLDRNRSTSKKDFIRQYKFTIAWENTYGEGYTTEKLSEPLMAGSVPIYWGSVPDYINPKSIVDVSKFANLNEVVDFVRFLDQDDAAYQEMLSTPPVLPQYNFKWMDDLSSFLKQIVDSDFAKRAKSPMNYDSVAVALRSLRKRKSFLKRLAMRWRKR